MQKNLRLSQAKNQKVWRQKLVILLNQIEYSNLWMKKNLKDKKLSHQYC